MRKVFFMLLLLLGLHLFLLFNLRFTAWPEMLSYPYLFSHGFTLYKDFVIPYPPLLTLVLSGIYFIFGYNIQVLQVFTWIYILASDFVFYLILRKIIGEKIWTYLIFIAYILLQSFLDGNMMWFDNALVLPILSAVYFALRWLDGGEKKYLYFTSLTLAAAIFIKQTAVIYYLIFSIFVFLKSRELKPLLVVPLISGAIFVLFLTITGSLGDFWNWTIYYPLTFWSKFPGYKNFNLDSSEIRILFFMFLPAIFLIPSLKNLLKKKDFPFLALLAIASIIAIYPRFSFFHLQPTIALLFLIYAYIFEKLDAKTQIAFLVMIFIGVLISIRTVFPWAWGGGVRFYEKEEKNLISTVGLLSQKEEKVFLLGLPSDIYALSDRLPPKPWADNFGWYWEIPGVQDEIINRWEQNPPRKIVWRNPMPGNWFDLGTYQPKLIIKWITQKYTKSSEIDKGIWLWRMK